MKKGKNVLLDILISCICIFFIGTYIYIALSRMFYPFELEWAEGAVFDNSYRILNGLPIYTKPTVDFVPLMYPPFYYFVSSFLIKYFGIEIWPLRIVSFISSLVSTILIFEITRKRTKSILWSLVSSSLFLGTFKITCSWFDLARVDSLFVMLVLSSFYLTVFQQGYFSVVLSSLSISCSFLTKQSGAIFIVVFGLWLLTRSIKKGALFLLTSIFICIGISLLLNHKTDGWFSYWVFKLPSYQPLLKEKIMMFFVVDLLKNMPILCGSAVGWIILFITTRTKNNIFDLDTLIFLFLGVSFFVSLSGRGITGGVENALIPLIASLSIIFGISCSIASESKKQTKPFLYGFLILQFIILFYNPMSQIPTKKDKEIGERFLYQVSSIQGDVFIPYHGYYLTKVGKRPYCYIGALSDVEFDKKQGRVLINDFVLSLKENLEKKVFGAIILSNEGIPSFDNFIRIYYNLAGTFIAPHESSAFYTICGWRRRPQEIYLPK
ncbi:TPA: hypothetical protein DCX16_00955 [bacterium]|nr:hypothetical protein [bacterium]